MIRSLSYLALNSIRIVRTIARARQIFVSSLRHDGERLLSLDAPSDHGEHVVPVVVSGTRNRVSTSFRRPLTSRSAPPSAADSREESETAA
jgi:hypothetical protein